MNKKSWAYTGKLKRHKVELAHIPETGKVYIRLNNILLYEDVMQHHEDTKTFQFFVDDELCIISIEKNGNQFAYRFTSPEVSTSRTARIRLWKDRLLLVAIAAVFGVVVGGLGVPFVYDFFHSRKLNNNLNLGGIITTAYLTTAPDINNLQTQDITISYNFKAGLHLVRAQTTIPAADSSLLALNSLFPVTEKNTFEVLYSATEPQVNRLLLNKPSYKQTEIYRQQAREACLKHHFDNIPRQTGQTLFCDCLITYFFTHYDLEGLARICHINTPEAQNKVFNANSYATFMQQDLPIEITKICTRNANN